MEVEDVDGPEMTKVSKSRRIWQMFSLHLQILVEQAPTKPVEDSKYVVFCVVLVPQVRVTIENGIICAILHCQSQTRDTYRYSILQILQHKILH